MKKTILFLILLFTGITVFNQTPQIKFDEITYKNGVNAFTHLGITVFQDRKGFIWISGGNGLQRYDGYEMVDYSCQIKERGNVKFMEDSRGLLWICSDGGIHLFDPETEKMKQYSPDSLNKRISKTIEDKNGTIWCASYGLGLLRMDPLIQNQSRLKEEIFDKGLEAAFTVSSFQINKTEVPDLANSLYDLVEDSLGRIWAGGRGGLYLFNKESQVFTHVYADLRHASILLKDTVFTMAAEKPDNLWVNTRKGYIRISNIYKAFTSGYPDGANLNLKEYKYLDRNLEMWNRTILIDHMKNFWIGYPTVGLTRMNVDLNHQASFELALPVPTKGNEFSSVVSIMEDRTGLIWLGHSYPVIRKFRPEPIPFTPLQGLLKNHPNLYLDFNQIYEDSEKNLWICTWLSGVFKISPNGKVINYMLSDPADPDQSRNSTVSILEIEKDIFWVSTMSGICQLDARTGKYHELFSQHELYSNYYAVKLIRQGDLIVFCTWSRIDYDPPVYYNLRTGKFTRSVDQFYKTPGLQSRSIRTGVLSRYGVIWLVADNSQIARSYLNERTGEISFALLPDSVIKDFQKIIKECKDLYIIDEDGEGNLWLYDRFRGLVIELDIQSGKIHKWPVKEGHYGSSLNRMFTMLEDNDGYIWLTDSYTLFRLDKKNGTIRNFDNSDCLPQVRHSPYCSLKDSKGTLYFGGINGFYRVDPEKIYKNTMIPSVVITGFRLFNQPVKIDSTRKAILTKNISYTQDIRLKYNQNDLSFTFASLDYNDPSKNKYAYKLEGYQKNWIEARADNRIASYTNLKPGKYIFRVKGSNNDDIWNEEGNFINITIHPPFWRTTLAYIVYAVLFLLLLRVYIFWRTRHLRKEKLILEEQVAERTHTIEEQKEELQSTLENLQKTQEQLVESEKMAAVGGLVAGVAHEMSTPVGIGITAISNLLDDVQKMAGLYEKGEISRKDFIGFLESTSDTSKLIQKNLERAGSLIQSFKQVSTDQVTEQPRIFEFKEYLNDILLSLRPKFREKKIDIKIECNDELQLNSYPGVYAQIFTNLLLNSLQHGFYKKDTGTIGIRAEIVKDLLKIQYTDDGAGISRKDLPHIFEPFYTSDQHRGTGLGLNIIYNLVKQKLHGTINCESEPGKGVLFVMEMPFQ